MSLSVRTDLEANPKKKQRFETVGQVLEFCEERDILASAMFRYLEAEAGGEYAPVPTAGDDPTPVTLDDIRQEFSRQCVFLGLPDQVTSRIEFLGNRYREFSYGDDCVLGTAENLAFDVDLYLSDLVREAEKTKKMRRQRVSQ